VLTVKQQSAALCVLAFFCIAMLCAESSRLAACDTISIHARTADKHSPVAGQRKALKRSVYAEEAAPPSDSARSPARYLSPEERTLDLVAFQARRVVAREKIPVPKVSTNLLLSVLNL
jgi:hypothetical protein